MLFSSLAPTTFLVTSVAIRFAFGDARDVPVNYANLKDLELEDYKLIDTDGAPIKAEKRGSYYQDHDQSGIDDCYNWLLKNNKKDYCSTYLRYKPATVTRTNDVFTTVTQFKTRTSVVLQISTAPPKYTRTIQRTSVSSVISTTEAPTPTSLVTTTPTVTVTSTTITFISTVSIGANVQTTVTRKKRRRRGKSAFNINLQPPRTITSACSRLVPPPRPTTITITRTKTVTTLKSTVIRSTATKTVPAYTNALTTFFTTKTVVYKTSTITPAITTITITAAPTTATSWISQSTTTTICANSGLKYPIIYLGSAKITNLPNTSEVECCSQCFDPSAPSCDLWVSVTSANHCVLLHGQEGSTDDISGVCPVGLGTVLVGGDISDNIISGPGPCAGNVNIVGAP